MLSILVTNAYSARNRGDAGIILGMLADLRGNPSFADATLTVSTQDYPGDTGIYPCRVVPSFRSIGNRFSRRPILACLGFLVLLLPLSLVWVLIYRITGRNLPLGGQFGTLMCSYTLADIIIAAGGGYLYTTSARRGFVTLFIQLYSFYVGALLGKPVYLYAQSIGPFQHSLQAALTRRAIRGARLVQVRENCSFRLLTSWHLGTPIHLTVDAAFLMPIEPSPVTLSRPDGRTLIGVTVRRWFDCDGDQNQFEAQLVWFLRWLQQEQDGSLFFLPQVTLSDGRDDDRVVARSLAGSLPGATVIETELSAPQLKALCAQVDYMIATRLHSAVFAASMGVPCLTIGYQPKAYGIMEQLGMTSFLLPIEELDLAKMQEKYRGLVDAADRLRRDLGRRVPELCQKARLNSCIISSDYSDYLGGRATQPRPLE